MYTAKAYTVDVQGCDGQYRPVQAFVDLHAAADFRRMLESTGLTARIATINPHWVNN